MIKRKVRKRSVKVSRVSVYSSSRHRAARAECAQDTDRDANTPRGPTQRQTVKAYPIAPTTISMFQQPLCVSVLLLCVVFGLEFEFVSDRWYWLFSSLPPSHRPTRPDPYLLQSHTHRSTRTHNAADELRREGRKELRVCTVFSCRVLGVVSVSDQYQCAWPFVQVDRPTPSIT